MPRPQILWHRYTERHSEVTLPTFERSSETSAACYSTAAENYAACLQVIKSLELKLAVLQQSLAVRKSSSRGKKCHQLLRKRQDLKGKKKLVGQAVQGKPFQERQTQCNGTHTAFPLCKAAELRTCRGKHCSWSNRARNTRNITAAERSKGLWKRKGDDEGQISERV